MRRHYNELFFLPFDHRSSFEKDLFQIRDREPTPEESEEVSNYKKLIYEGFQLAIELGVPKQKCGILVDEKFGRDILSDAKENGFWTACSVEKSGSAEFVFEYGSDFKEHLRKIRPDFAKVLVRFNPEGDHELNRRQSERLKTLSEFCIENDFGLMLELLVPATVDQASSVAGATERYVVELRPRLMVLAMRALQDHGVEPAIWKVEGVSNGEDCQRIAAQAQINSREQVRVIVLGGGESLATTKEWLTVAAATSGYAGFAIGRTVWENALKKLSENQMSSADAVLEIARNFKSFCDLWVASRPATFASSGKFNTLI